jgi:hypothetical protein
MASEENKSGATMVAGTAAAAAGATALAAKKSPRQKRSEEIRKKEQQRTQARKDKTVSMRNQANATAAQGKLDRLQNIKPSDLSGRDKKVRKALIQEQKSILKGATKSTAKEIAKKVGLRSIPVVGAFLAAFESTPAYSRGGVVKKKK